MKKKNIFLIVLASLFTVALFGLVIFLQKDISALLEKTGPFAFLVFYIVQLLSVILAPIPSNITAAAGSIIFGPVKTFLITYAAILTGSILVFSFVRIFKNKFNRGRLEEKLEDRRYLSILYEKPSAFLFLSFLLPIFPDDIICYLAGLTMISPWKFILICALARPWGLLVASGIGVFGKNVTKEKIVFATGILLLLLVLLCLYKFFLHERIVGYLERRKKER